LEINMFNPNKITKILGATFVLVATTSVMAETLTVPSTVTVDNTIDFQTLGSLDFGIVRATVDGAGSLCAGIVVSANPATANTTTLAGTAATACPNVGTSVLQTVGGTVARPTFTVAGLAPFTVLQIAVPNTTTAPVEMDLTPKPAGAPSLQLYDFTVYRSSGTTPAFVTLTNGAGTIDASSTGAIAFSVGATLTTDAAASTLTYQNVAYTADFDVTVTY
jgi:hypothetical protein